MTHLVFATNNLNKLKEVQVLIPKTIKLLSLKDIGCFEDIPETKETIEGNAFEKAQFVKTNYGYDCFADDTGLEVDALNGAPGVYSARYAGPQRDAVNNMDLLLKNLKFADSRSAQFKTVIALSLNSKLSNFTGICKGHITREKYGSKGFGYDPIFKPTGYDETFAEMDLSIKNQIGHRGKAVKQLVNFLNTLS
ncbi:non-canonical purine NTP diphosphatase [Hyunsoonleella ulvae]|uniref:non-canonical purine NTP diphosphatase n=1 Tax=Hyunsoonleella ulvae TaxID=2799948 RepID=UPI001939F948|nr:non-canonical purine NTP diphosphatase [Hyunsoonleella ulvae]